jgi:hypothetical protein
MKYQASPVSNLIVKIHCTPSWLGRLFGAVDHVVYAQRGETDTGWHVWVLGSGREVTSGMLDAIDELPLGPES